jgi:hypothetical protein
VCARRCWIWNNYDEMRLACDRGPRGTTTKMIARQVFAVEFWRFGTRKFIFSIGRRSCDYDFLTTFSRSRWFFYSAIITMHSPVHV